MKDRIDHFTAILTSNHSPHNMQMQSDAAKAAPLMWALCLMKLSQATEEHLKEVISWIPSSQDCLMWAGPKVSYPILLSTLIDEIDFKSAGSYVLENAEELVGFGQILRIREATNHIARIAITPKHRGNGYGFKICNGLLSLAEQNATKVTLNVYRSNRPAVALYTKMGFREVKEKSTSDNIYMVKA